MVGHPGRPSQAANKSLLLWIGRTYCTSSHSLSLIIHTPKHLGGRAYCWLVTCLGGSNSCESVYMTKGLGLGYVLVTISCTIQMFSLIWDHLVGVTGGINVQ